MSDFRICIKLHKSVAFIKNKPPIFLGEIISNKHVKKRILLNLFIIAVVVSAIAGIKTVNMKEVIKMLERNPVLPSQ